MSSDPIQVNRINILCFNDKAHIINNIWVSLCVLSVCTKFILACLKQTVWLVGVSPEPQAVKWRLGQRSEVTRGRSGADSWTVGRPCPGGPPPHSRRPSSSEDAPPGPRWSRLRSASTGGSRSPPSRWPCGVPESAGRSLEATETESSWTFF